MRLALWTLAAILTKEAMEWMVQVIGGYWYVIADIVFSIWYFSPEIHTARIIGGSRGHRDLEIDSHLSRLARPAFSMDTLADFIFLSLGFSAIGLQMGLCSEQTQELEKAQGAVLNL